MRQLKCYLDTETQVNVERENSICIEWSRQVVQQRRGHSPCELASDWRVWNENSLASPLVTGAPLADHSRASCSPLISCCLPVPHCNGAVASSVPYRSTQPSVTKVTQSSSTLMGRGYIKSTPVPRCRWPDVNLVFSRKWPTHELNCLYSETCAWAVLLSLVAAYGQEMTKSHSSAQMVNQDSFGALLESWREGKVKNHLLLVYTLLNSREKKSDEEWSVLNDGKI